ncbi:thioredoxin [Halieaceae bacterium IMCC14734]|uniref:Thioredoxin n=1 Tax=Candidatus Litorirhabdus singularis TaxID=2518993 RepID=A0ABT3TDJ3_9GAMM|nr:thioredoxin family protein [Candidatus Litorirhabdus singularis]MCX2980367.1 thioredoxin [Candidatus Litorirhabdus singularis]
MTEQHDSYLVFLKRDCPTCVLVEPALRELESAGKILQVWSQDDPEFPGSLTAVGDDRELEQSYHWQVETVPTVIRLRGDKEVERTEGWDRAAWLNLFGTQQLAEDLPGFRPGCGSLSVQPGVAEELALRYGTSSLQARRIEIAELEDPLEACYARGWSDGLPVVPPTELRVIRMLAGTHREPAEIVGLIPPDLQPCSIEKIAINAVMAGCKPEYLPVVIAAVEAALIDEFCMHGLLATTWFSSPMIIVNGPITKAIGMNSGGNALGQGNRANATIGRALQLVIRNVGGGKPGGVDRATLGNPGKYTFCFAEDESEQRWQSVAQQRGFESQQSTVTLFAADGVQGIADQKSREPESLCRSLAASLLGVGHRKFAMLSDAFIVLCPEHLRVFTNAGWSKQQVLDRLFELTTRSGAELINGVDGIAEGMPEFVKDMQLAKFKPNGLNIVCAGGTAGLFSAIVPGWLASGDMGSSPVTKEIV